MLRPCLAICCLMIVRCPTALSQTSPPPENALEAIRPEIIHADMAFLADDLLEGRAPGTRGYSLGAAYVASRFASLSLRPGGDNGTYLQQIPLRSMRLDEAATKSTLRTRSGDQALRNRQDIILWPNPGQPMADVEAPLVFVGYGISAPALHHDDYAKLDVRGKIVVALYGAPAFSNPSLKAHYSAGWVKRSTAADHGAVGYLALYSEDLQSRYPFEKMAEELDSPGLAWLDPKGAPNDYYPALKCEGFVSTGGANLILANSGHSIAEIFRAAKAGKLLPFQIPNRAAFHTVTQSSDINSPNVVGILDGADPTLKNEYLVYSAHLDHIGIGQPVDGDTIYNGALDNASGVASMLSIAEAFSHAAARPRRSVVFVAVTGEESGLLGSDYFARYPPVPKGSIVADLNIDGGVPIWPLGDIIGFGSEHSSLAETLRRAAEQMHLTLSPDPHPDEVMFVRSDQYSFVRQGIPSAFVSAGMHSSDPSIDPERRLAEWEATRYHEPSDDMRQPNLDFASAAAFAKVNLLAGWSIANEASKPTWNPGDFFAPAVERKPR